MHIGDKDPKFIYKMRDQELDNIKQENDLGVIISCDLKMSDQCTSKKANMTLGLISINFDHKSAEVMKRLYTAFVRPQNMRFNSGYRITLRTKIYWKEYRDERQANP